MYFYPEKGCHGEDVVTRVMSFAIRSRYSITNLLAIESTIKHSEECNMYGSFKNTLDNKCLDW